jgi:hypothetical protein
MTRVERNLRINLLGVSVILKAEPIVESGELDPELDIRSYDIPYILNRKLYGTGNDC